MEFGFQPTRYEDWMGGQMVASGPTRSPIFARKKQLDGEERIEIGFNDPTLGGKLAATNVFDVFVTGKDRLQLVTIPAEPEAGVAAVSMFQQLVGITRPYKAFGANEPYCCNLFLKEGRIDKLTFSFSNPERLLEFYQDGQATAEEGEPKLEFVFQSSYHIRYQNGVRVTQMPPEIANRAIQVEPNIQGGEGFTVSMFNVDIHPPKSQMAPKQMKVIAAENNQLKLRGFGTDPMGFPFSDYGLTVYLGENGIEKCVLHMYDRNINIEYFP